MHPSSSASRVGSRAVTVKYAHSPYAYRTSVEDGPTSPMSDMGRQDSTSSPQYHSPRSLSQSGAYGEGSGLLHAAGSHTDLQSQPSSPLGRSAPGQEYSQPIQVGSAPNVHPRYRRGMQSPMSRPGLDSGSRSGFPTSPSSSLPPRSPFMGRDEGTSSFNGGESAPVRGSNNPYRMHATTGVSAPQYSVPLSGSFRGGNQSGTQSPGPHHSRQPSTSGMPMGGNPNNNNNNNNNSQSNSNNCSTTQNYSQAMNSSGTAAPYYAPPTPASSMSGATPHYGSSNNNGTAGGNTYAPTGFSMPPAMAAGNASSFHGSPSGRGGSQCPTLADSRSSHPSSPLQSASNRLAVGSAMHQREPTSPNHQFSSSGTAYGGGGGGLEGGAYSPSSHHHNSLKSGGANGAPPPAFATAMSQQQSSGGFGVGSFPGRRAQGPPGHSPSSPYSNSHMNASGHDVSLMSESYGTNTKTLSTMADDTVSSSGKSGSSASSIRDDLPLCPTDDACTMINDRKHQKKYAHTCRLFPCYHGHVTRHAKLFRHAPGQISFPEGLSANAKVSSQALASVNFSTISPEAPNAYRIYVSHADKSYEIFGDWASVKVHTFKRYLHQVYHIAPGSQVLSVLKTGKVMDDDINSVKCYGIEEDSVIELRSDSEDGPATGKMRIPLDDL